MLDKKYFRAKNYDNEWVYGSLIEDYSDGSEDRFYILENKPATKEYPRISRFLEDINGHITPVRKETICQYIEQMNWHGSYFFEGDIVRFKDSHVRDFKSEDLAVVVSESCIFYDRFGRCWHPQYTLDYEIVGNVIDNLDMLSERSIKWIRNYGWLREKEG